MHLLVAVYLQRYGTEKTGTVLNDVLNDETSLRHGLYELFVAMLPLIGSEERLFGD